MKKSILIAVMLMALLIPSAYGCNDKTDAPAPQPTEIVLADFERWAPDFQLLRPMNRFGVISRNDNPDYVRSGSHSALLQPMGGYSLTTEPFFYMPTVSDLFEFDYSDFSKTESVSASVYNAEETAQTMKVGLITEIASVSQANRAAEFTVSLAPGWNDVVYTVDIGLLSISYDVEKIAGISFAFQNAGIRESEDAPKLYIDDVTIYLNPDMGEVGDIVTFDENEICGFDKLYQRYIVTVESDNLKCLPDASVVLAEDYGIKATEGTHVLRVVTKPGDSDNANDVYPRFVIPESIMEKSAFGRVGEDQYENTYFKFDVYNNSSTERTLFPELHFGSEVRNYAFNVVSRVGRWVTFSVSLAKIIRESGQPSLVKEPGSFSVAWWEYITPAENQEFFFDNIRIETVP